MHRADAIEVDWSKMKRRHVMVMMVDVENIHRERLPGRTHPIRSKLMH